jgi:hypothetical protein
MKEIKELLCYLSIAELTLVYNWLHLYIQDRQKATDLAAKLKNAKP